jgi:ribonuclease P protein component
MPDQRAFRRRGESLLREERLRKRADFQRCYERGRRRHSPLATLYFRERGEDARFPRLGITVTRKVGGAVVRQRVKRRMREIYRRWSERRSLPAYDLVLHARPTAATAPFAQLEEEIQGLLMSLLQRRSRAG